MKKLLLPVFCFFGGIIICYGQTVYKLDKDTSKFKRQPVFILKRPLRDPLETSNFVGNPNDIYSINVYKYPHGEDTHGHKVVNGVVEFILKNGGTIINFDQLLTNFKIDYKSRDLPVYIDSAIANNPQKAYFEPTAVKYVRIEVEEETGMKYINIRTTYPINRPKKGEIYIRG